MGGTDGVQFMQLENILSDIITWVPDKTNLYNNNNIKIIYYTTRGYDIAVDNWSRLYYQIKNYDIKHNLKIN